MFNGNFTVHTNASNINHYLELGFQKVCVVSEITNTDKWVYGDINNDLLYSQHTSWVYCIVDDETIVKVGETGLPLGIQTTQSRRIHLNQPRTGTTNRFGRLANMSNNDPTDQRIREELRESVLAGKVSLWAKDCPIAVETIQFGNTELLLKKTFHKELELLLLDYMTKNGHWPRLNSCRK